MINKTVSAPAVTENHRTASRKHFEQFATQSVANFRKTWALILVTVIVIAGLVDRHLLQAQMESWKPKVVRINEIGRAETIYFGQNDYKPLAIEAKYYLGQFVEKFNTRNRAVTQADYGIAKLMLAKQRKIQLEAEDRKSDWMKAFMSGQGEECDVDVTNIRLIDFREDAQPYRAEIDWDKIDYSGGRIVKTRQHWTTVLSFYVAGPQSSPILQKYNPLGFAVEYWDNQESSAQPVAN